MSCTQRTPAGFPSGMPGIGDEIEGAVQHAPHAGRQSIAGRITFCTGRTAGGKQMPDEKLPEPGTQEHGFGGDYARDTHRGLGDDYARDGGFSGGGSADQYTRESHTDEGDAVKNDE